MHKGFIITSAVIGFLSVALGAFAAHSLRETISDHAVNIFETGVRYQFYHAFAIMAVGILYEKFNRKWLKVSAWCFILGTILFSFSLYALALIKGAVMPGYNWIGAITPFGGLFFLAGWVFLILGCRKEK